MSKKFYKLVIFVNLKFMNNINYLCTNYYYGVFHFRGQFLRNEQSVLH